MDHERSSKQSNPRSAPPLTQLLRRLRYQGTAQWMTLILVVSCIGLFVVTTPLSSYHRRQTAKVSADRSDAETGPDSENAILPSANDEEEANGKAKMDSLEADLVEEAVPEFTGPKFWDGVDWDDPLELPDKVAGNVFEMTVETGEEDIELKGPNGDLQVVTVFFRESIPKTKPKMDILLLHGSRFNSETWITVDTTKTFAAMGYRATAIDLPGFGNSAGQVMFGERASQFIEAFCQAHGLKNPVIVAPSMAGGYALPYLMSRPYNVTALIALAPTSTERYNAADYQKVQVPILVIYGTKDSTFGAQVQRRLYVAPNAQTKLIQDAYHATYLDQPDEWHRIAYILFRRLDAWAENQKKSGVTTTQHPPVVTHMASETLPPEILLPALNVPKMRKFENRNGFDELPSGGFVQQPSPVQAGTMGEFYGQVAAVNGKLITPEEAAKFQLNQAPQIFNNRPIPQQDNSAPLPRGILPTIVTNRPPLHQNIERQQGSISQTQVNPVLPLENGFGQPQQGLHGGNMGTFNGNQPVDSVQPQQGLHGSSVGTFNGNQQGNSVQPLQTGLDGLQVPQNGLHERLPVQSNLNPVQQAVGQPMRVAAQPPVANPDLIVTYPQQTLHSNGPAALSQQLLSRKPGGAANRSPVPISQQEARIGLGEVLQGSAPEDEPLAEVDSVLNNEPLSQNTDQGSLGKNLKEQQQLWALQAAQQVQPQAAQTNLESQQAGFRQPAAASSLQMSSLNEGEKESGLSRGNDEPAPAVGLQALKPQFVNAGGIADPAAQKLN